MSDLDANLSYKTSENDYNLMRSVARELAYDIIPLETILDNHRLTPDDFERISRHQQFQSYLREFVEQWSAADNGAARTRLKITAGIEESLPDMFALLHDNNFAANARVELFKTLLQAGGMRGTANGADGGGNAGDRVSITINMGDGRDVTVQAETQRSPIDYEGAEDA